METALTSATDPAELREALVTSLIDSGNLRTPEVIAAFRATERHQFHPDADLPSAYASDVVLIKQGDKGETLSCISNPSVVATQLEQLGAAPGHKILEAGAASGYNAALLGQLVVPGGHVWTVDVDQDLVDTATDVVEPVVDPIVDACADVAGIDVQIGECGGGPTGPGPCAHW
jgi:protein-L-isoaspartate(D-aspartate) O-methyltransferase